MGLHRVVENFSSVCAACLTADELLAQTASAAQELGFDRVAMVHGLWFRCPSHRLIRLDTFGEWADIFIDRRYYLDCPTLMACQRESAAFGWIQLPNLIHLGHRQRRVLADARRHGLHNGFTLPVGVMGEPSGCCSFTCAKPELPSRWRCRAAALIAADAFSRARQLHGFPARARQLPHLSKRELECLCLIAIGKTDEVIGSILGLSPTTTRSYAAALRRKFDVVSRQQLSVEALRFGLIGFDDAIPQG